MEDGRPPRALRILYAVVVVAVAAGGLLTIVDWARRGDELPGGAVPVTGRVVEERPGFTGALAIVEVAYDAGGKERRARLPVPGSDENPQLKTFEPGDPIALLVSVPHSRLAPGRRGGGAPGPDLPARPPPAAPGRLARSPENWRRERDLNPRGGFTPPNRLAGGHLRPLGHPSVHALTCTFAPLPASRRPRNAGPAASARATV